MDSIYWEGLVAQPIFKGWNLEEIKLHIADQGQDQPRSRHGRPVLAERDVATRALNRMAGLSERYGTKIRIQDGIGYVTLA